MKAKLLNAENVSIKIIPEGVNKVVVIFDVVKGYSEWDFINYIGESLYFPIGDGFGIVIN